MSNSNLLNMLLAEKQSTKKVDFYITERTNAFYSTTVNFPKIDRAVVGQVVEISG